VEVPRFGWDWTEVVPRDENPGYRNVPDATAQGGKSTHTTHVVELNEKLVIINPDGPNLDNPIELEPIGDGTFRYAAPAGGGPVGEIVRFVEENGQVVRMITGDSYVERVRQ